MMSGHGTVETAVEATRLGAYDFVEKPLSLPSCCARWNARSMPVAPAERQVRHAGAPARRGAGRPQPRDDAAAQRTDSGSRPISAPLLLLGESGTDRELLARFVHQSGRAAAGPFVALDSRTLREDRRRRRCWAGTAQPGLLEQARGGTLFLGDIEDLPETQRLLSGVLESGRFVRAAAASRAARDAHHLLGAARHRESRAGTEDFRRDLYAQLSVLLVRVPSLRDYAEDVPELLRHYVDELTETEGCVSAASASRRRIGCAIIPGRTTCASCAISRDASCSTPAAGGDRARGGRARAVGADAGR
jgi:two-component system, NtrC family, nitrogen regulation response regulator NtrX